MDSIRQAVMSSWSFDPWLVVGLTVTLGVYFRGWRILSRVMPTRFSPWRLASFAAGLAGFGLAITSPLDAFSGLLLSAHMIQHLILMSVAPPLILLGSPFLPLMRGLPRSLAHDGLGPFLTWPALKRAGRLLTHPVVGWLALVFSLGVWHLPVAFDLGLRSNGWHALEHACFFAGAILFWWPIVSPFPSRPVWPPWAFAMYLLAADVANTVLCAILTFSDKVIYLRYAAVPRLFGTTALSDQAAAGVIMWVPGSLVLLIPATVLMIRYLSPDSSLLRPMGQGVVQLGQKRLRSVSSLGAKSRFDLLRVPILGRVLRAAPTRRFAQGIMLVVAVVVMVDGFWGPPASSENLAGVLPWLHWRALTVVALLVAGNFFCFACPFMLPRELAHRLGWAVHAWPRRLRSKWLAIGLLVAFFWAYEAFNLWDHPGWTAALILTYFVTAALIDAWFRGASFCKYVCPIGQFHFVTSALSPLEIKVREPEVCTTCQTHDCLRGNAQQRGCETQLYLPRKVGNLDCTFCLDCVRACPHDNVGMTAMMPGLDLMRDPPRSGLGRFSRRLDVGVLAGVLVAAAFSTAAAMTAPMAGLRTWIIAQIEASGTSLVFFLGFVFALFVLPVSLTGLAVLMGRWVAEIRVAGQELLSRFCLALVPLGTAMWAAHFLFHWLAGPHILVPLIQARAAATGTLASGLAQPGEPLFAFSIDHLLTLQGLLLDAGFLLTLYVGWQIARGYSDRVGTALRLVLPWFCWATVLYGVGVWILLQPMEMRGVLKLVPG